MKKIVFSTTGNYAPLALRLLLSFVLFPHGAQKLFGWFGGFGFEGSMAYFTQDVGLPWIIGFAVIMIEFFGPLFLVLGLGTRLWSLGILAIMTGVIVTTFNDYFFMNWFGSQKAEGYEFFLLAIGMALSLIISGGGKFSLDAFISRNNSKQYQGVGFAA
ncbi:MAG TPA: DoxX family protein [Flavisolibacter sp.]|jgi:putative oxidoreductase|nr:DoxX family protein [Flavisolibacter sp.]